MVTHYWRMISAGSGWTRVLGLRAIKRCAGISCRTRWRFSDKRRVTCGGLAMDLTAVLFLVGFLFVFSWMFYMLFQSNRKEKETKQQVAQSLGFSPIEPDTNLTEKICNLYRRTWTNKSYELRHVARRVIPEGEMFLFDLLDASTEDYSPIERQAVAVISPALNFPPFTLFPRASQQYALSNLANRMVE